MKIKVDNNFAVVIDNWYTEKEYNEVLKECKFASSYLRDPEYTGSAKTKEGTLLKSNKAIFISSLFRDFYKSHIGTLSQKLYEEDFINDLKEKDNFYSYLEWITDHDCLISYYEESDYYKSHTDNAILTSLIWLYDEPKYFEGGNLILRDQEDNFVEEIECIPNRALIFPSYMKHEVTSISMDKKDLNKNRGRFTISQFSFIGGSQ